MFGQTEMVALVKVKIQAWGKEQVMVIRIRPNLPYKLVIETDFLFTEDSRLRIQR